MEPEFLTRWIGRDQIVGTCWTMVHSLWIGLIVAGLTGLVMGFTTKARAALRYWIFCGLMVGFVVAVGIAGIYELGGSAAVAKEKAVQSQLKVPASSGSHVAAQPLTITERASVLLKEHSSLIVGLWLLFFVFKVLRLLRGIFHVHRIRTYQVFPIDEQWMEKTHLFAARLGISRKIEVVQSALVKVPLALGYLRPMIVLPIGLVFSVPMAQVETILFHELAHICRKDYVMNILQKTVEALFFFNPGVLWLSALIREERELCCDDIVLSQTKQKANYLAALMAFHGSEDRAGSLAMGLSMRPGQLMRRLRRMVGEQNKQLSAVELIVLVFGFVLLTAFMTIPQVDKRLKNGAIFVHEVVAKTFVQAKEIEVNHTNDGVKTSMRSDRQVQPDRDSLRADTPIVIKSMKFNGSNQDPANREMNVIDANDNSYHITVAGGKITSVNYNARSVDPAEFGKYRTIVQQVDRTIANKPTGAAIQEDPNLKRKKEYFSPGSQVDKKTIGDSTTTGRQVIKVPNGKITDKGMIGTQGVRKIPTVDASSDRDRVLGVIGSLVEQKVVTGLAAVEWFALTNEQLVVNGRKQPADLHQALKKKYNIRADYGLFFGPTKIHGTGIVFDKKNL